MNSITSIGLQALNNAGQSAAENAQKVSQGPASEKFVEGAIGLKLDSLQFKAAASVIKTADEMTGMILDIIA